MSCHSRCGQPSDLLFQKTIGAATNSKMQPQEKRFIGRATGSLSFTQILQNGPRRQRVRFATHNQRALDCSGPFEWAPEYERKGASEIRPNQSVCGIFIRNAEKFPTGADSWAECRQNKTGIKSSGRTFLWTFPFIGHFAGLV